MGAPDAMRGRDDEGRTAQYVADTSTFEEPKQAQSEAAREDGQEVPPAYEAGPHPESNSSFGVGGVLDDEKEVERNPDRVTESAALGQQKAEAAALVWSRPVVFAIYAWIWVGFFMLAFHSAINSSLLNWVYGSFKAAPQVSTSYILASIIGGVLKLPLAKTLQLWGRAEALLFSTAIYILGMIILAACDGPNAFAAGYVLYWIGYYCVYLILDIFVADTTGLRSRAFAFAFASTPFICTAFTGSLAAQSIYNTSGWRWGYGMFCIIQPVVLCPLAMVFKFYERKAIKMGVWQPRNSDRTKMQSIVHYFHEFDVIGAFLLMIAWVLFLLPFSLAQYGRSQYHSASFIAMVIVGFCMLFVFAAWEKWFARHHFIRYELLKKPTILGACICAAVAYFSFYLWDQYFYNFVLITYNLNISMAGYMTQIYNVGSCFWSPILGLIIWWTRRFKYIVLCFGVPLMLLGSGLMIYFRGADHGIGYIVMCQIFIAFAGGTIVIGEDMAVMAAGGREGTPMMLALIGLFSSIGGAIGYAVSAAIYNNVFVEALASQLPDNLKSNATQIYLDGINVQNTYPVGSVLRNACIHAWSYAQRMNCIASTCILILLIPAVAVWKNYDVGKKQNKGTMLFD
ncbi:Siderochrome iron transporter 2 [Penicillium macrosclerotiorum]|uniref:Siderochrome iron transporter 2 n=1 Tax=Penicillium macrosclerotiorum TaxID=303699 RepID=UPI002546BAD9|nr:Siderochrome iron transporter 2 [Penicillium macrosclerotiorum]KAJ5682166.1 Siderochrome iron transporter 2 [Penicillium macrosclerotiorum]